MVPLITERPVLTRHRSSIVDPRNRGLNLNRTFRRCVKNKGRTLVIIGKQMEQFCEFDNSRPESADGLQDVSHLPSKAGPEPVQGQWEVLLAVKNRSTNTGLLVIEVSATRSEFKPTATQPDASRDARRGFGEYDILLCAVRSFDRHSCSIGITPPSKPLEAARPTVPSRRGLSDHGMLADVSAPQIPRTALYRLLARIMSLFSITTWILVLPFVLMVTGALWVPFFGSQYLQVGRCLSLTHD